MKPARGQPAVQGRVDERSKILRVKDFAGYGDRRGPRGKLRSCQFARCVTANGREDILAILLKPAVRGPIGIKT